ncbi:APC amino acid permease [Epithele typhae]|uniref:APC amino acid permease n=1 Tax=Epithele typhae TaxID=378194 RepID=UPI002007852C|nr:APC amino acid permease [Epithele typhae]KAH9918712.1 APC amino acid permease [Epithele typhae]
MSTPKEKQDVQVRDKASDNDALAALGYKQEFKRAFHPVEVFGLGFSIIGLFPSISSVLVFALPYGGPVALVWGWGICSCFLFLVACALAELGSAAPTSGGLYYWTWMYATPRWRKVLSWLVGYMNSVGLIAGLASIDWGCAVQLLAAVSIGSDETFVPTVAQTYGVYAALLICHAVVASLATSIIARLQGVYIALNLLLCLAVIIALPVATPKEFRNDASFAFGGFMNFQGWPNGFSFVLSFLAPLWTIGGFDAPVHISEEASNARTAVPWAIVCGVGIAGLLGFILNIVISLFMGTDIENILSNPIGQPMATILFNSLGKRGALGIWSIVVFVQFLMGSAILTAASRQMFAFARDGALPFSGVIYRVYPRTQTPVVAVVTCAGVALALGLISFAGTVADSALFSLAIVGQYTAFAIPIASRFLGGASARGVWVPGPFTLGRLGAPVAAVAVAWMTFSIVILAFPTAPGPEASSMNYMVVVWLGVVALSLFYYNFPRYGGKHWFKGPQVTLDADSVAGSIEGSGEGVEEKHME